MPAYDCADDRDVIRNPIPGALPLMSRLHVLANRPRRTLAALATVLVAVGITAASGADFTASSANPTNTFATGTLTMSNSKDAAAIFTASNLKPGGPAQTGTVDIANTGSLPGTFTLTRGTISDSDSSNPLSVKLNMTVVDCGVYVGATPPTCGDGDDVTKYTGTLAAMGAGTPISALGSFPSSAKHTYKFSVSLDSSADNPYQGDTSETVFTWNAIS
jgi:spore coat-associated protein N